MELYLQLGHNMMPTSRELIERWGEGTVILSPRDFKMQRLKEFARDISKLGGSVLLDPQMYDLRADHPRLTEHEHWPSSFSTDMMFDKHSVAERIAIIREMNDAVGSDACILPGFLCRSVSDDWCAVQELIVTASSSMSGSTKRLATICLSSDVLRFENEVEDLLSVVEHWDVEGFYVVAEHPNGSYLVDEPTWLANLLIFCAGLKLQGREVIVGYCSQQQLCLAAGNVDAIASGTYLNLRSFNTQKFRQNDDDSVSRRSTWYYCPQSLSEYRTVYLDAAYQSGILHTMEPDPKWRSDYADVLFSGTLPTLTNFSEKNAFFHFLQCLRGQALEAKKATYSETLQSQNTLLDSVDGYIDTFHSNGVRGQARDFGDYTDVARSALAMLNNARGFALSQEWQ